MLSYIFCVNNSPNLVQTLSISLALNAYLHSLSRFESGSKFLSFRGATVDRR